MQSTSSPIIQFTNISKFFGNFCAVSHLNFEIQAGEILGFVGPNGAGKSTTMKMLAGLLQPTEGEIHVSHNSQWVRLTPSTRDTLMERMGFLIETPAFYEHMTPRSLLTYYAKLNGYPRDRISQRVQEVLELVGLGEWANRPVKQFSKGMRQKLGIVAAIVHDPGVAVLDEPQSGLDPKAQKEMRDFIRLLKEQGKTVFLSSHNLYEITEVADRVAIISHGELVALDTLQNLEAAARHPRINVRVLNKLGNGEIGDIIAQFDPLITPLAGSPLESGTADAGGASAEIMKYNPDSGEFEIDFDGSPQAQRDILKQLIDGGLEVIEFTVPKTSLLEQLYLSLVKEGDQKNLEDQRNQKKQKTRHPAPVPGDGVEFVSK
ncbi:MAG TPA: ABC transporter ATP-binding protein [Candidatus Lokiarchaeia archaeon]|nr:ABC transporter ATP-binding protein [Candidatus Lokiarchaeia archaeon]